MKFLDFFAGIGGFRMGFEQVGHECVGHVEWDKYAQASYAAIYGQGREEEYANEFNGWDITTIAGADLPRADLWNFGAPCQDFSMAGKRAGLGGERSSLVQEVFRLYRETAEENRPTYLIYENVKGMLSSNGGRDFLAIITEMESLGFVVEWGMLNSKYWGVPQNRERVFTVGTRVDKWNGPIMQDLLLAQEVNGVQTKLRDVLEDSVDEKYYLAPEKTERLVMQLDNRNKADDQIKILGHRKGYRRNTQVFDESGLTETLDTGMGGGRGHYTMETESDIQVIGNVGNTGYGAEDVLGIDGISKTLLSKDYKGPKKILEASGIYTQDSEAFHRGAVPGLSRSLKANKFDAGVIYQISRGNNKGGEHKVAPTLTSNSYQDNNFLVERYRIRKLTPKECWRLQGFPDWAFEEASKVCSDSQLYKQAGNSVSVPVIKAIAERLGN